MGQLAIVLSLVLACGALVAGIVRPRLTSPITRFAAVFLWAGVGFAVAALIREDTSLVLVVDHTRPGLSVARRVMGLWGGSEGSLLLFAAIVGGVTAWAPTRPAARWFSPLVMSALAATLVFLAPPFETLANPAIRGSGLSPILEHWAMLIHPPLLYTGLALALVPALANPEAHARTWTTGALVALTGALALGGRWAYVELGWGGWWAWDPVENVALIPWLLLIVHVHLPPRHGLAQWSAAAIWPAVFAGTAMTRTSLRTSVHSFANADGLGWVLWPLTLAVAAYAIALVVRSSTTRSNRRAPMVAAIVVLFAAVVVALGTFRPFVPGEATAGWFYSRSLYPVVIPALIAMGVGPRFGAATQVRLVVELASGMAIGAAVVGFSGATEWFQLVLAAALGGAVITTLGGARQHNVSRVLGHLGMVCVLAGALGGTASSSLTVQMDRGETRTIHGTTVINRGVVVDDGPPATVTAEIDVDGNTLAPSFAVYPERGLRLPEVATDAGLLLDRQYILRSADDDGSITLTANSQPLTSVVWIGVGLLGVAFAIRRRSRWFMYRPADMRTVAGDPDVGVPVGDT